MKNDQLKEYERKQDKIKKLLKKIEAGLEKHDRKASKDGGHHWGHVGDLNYVADRLEEARNFLMRMGEYA